MTTAPTRRKDPLGEARTDRADDDQPVTPAAIREIVVKIVGEARTALPDGVPDDSPIATATRDQLINMSNSMGIGHAAPVLTEEELRLCLEHARLIKANADIATRPQNARVGKPNPAVPAPEPDRFPPLRGAPESPVGKYRCKVAKRCSFQGQMFWVEVGSIIETRHYGPTGLQALVDQGLQLEALTE